MFGFLRVLSMGLRTALTDMLGIEHPIVLAPMGGVAGGVLTAAVSKAAASA